MWGREKSLIKSVQWRGAKGYVYLYIYCAGSVGCLMKRANGVLGVESKDYVVYNAGTWN